MRCAPRSHPCASPSMSSRTTRPSCPPAQPLCLSHSRSTDALDGGRLACEDRPGGRRQGDVEMYGLIGKIRAAPGKRDEVLTVLLDATGALPGCLSYIVASDPADTSAIWVTEVWTDSASHKASLSLPDVQAAIARAKPLI